MAARAHFGTFYAYSLALSADIASRRLATEWEIIMYWMLLRCIGCRFDVSYPPGFNVPDV
jgi:hypothetical protein